MINCHHQDSRRAKAGISSFTTGKTDYPLDDNTLPTYYHNQEQGVISEAVMASMLSQQQAKRMQFIWAAQNPMIVFDDQLQISFVNQALCQMLNYQEQQMINQPLLRFIIEDDQTMTKQLNQILISGRAAGQMTILDHHGQHHPVEYNASANILPGQHLAIIIDHPVSKSPTTAKASNLGYHLSPRETQVLQLLADGNRGSEIADDLCISPETVRVHLRNAMNKMDARTRAHAVAKAIKDGVITV